MDDLVHTVLSACMTCQASDKSAKMFPAPMQPVEFPKGPFQHAIDIVGPFEKGATDCKFANTLIDYFSKWPEVGFVSSVTTETVLKFLTTIFAREGNPCTITTDNGLQFTSSKFADFVKTQGIKHIKTSVYHPQVNWAIERFNRVLKECLQAAEMACKPWKSAVLTMLKSYRATPHTTMAVIVLNALIVQESVIVLESVTVPESVMVFFHPVAVFWHHVWKVYVT
ncbi:Integrase core domain [Labeo rohita]|uniref:Integrase core domain n=1 Tax=Labeo rohita TaxID=84645 RepID=A0A498NY65_LABRO|nr:Integrase core domain [Labeo rohita]